MIRCATIRQASGEIDTESVAHLWTCASQWLHQQGFDQWQYPVRLEGIQKAAESGTCWIVEHENKAIGTITLDREWEDFWRPEENPNDALYVHRMVVSKEATGIALGTAMLDWASKKAEESDKNWLRLDAWRSNKQLHQYYLGQGFRIVRIAEHPRNPSGALFEKPASWKLNDGPDIQELPTAERHADRYTDKEHSVRHDH